MRSEIYIRMKYAIESSEIKRETLLLYYYFHLLAISQLLFHPQHLSNTRSTL